jgi:hypothetical protein
VLPARTRCRAGLALLVVELALLVAGDAAGELDAPRSPTTPTRSSTSTTTSTARATPTRTRTGSRWRMPPPVTLAELAPLHLETAGEDEAHEHLDAVELDPLAHLAAGDAAAELDAPRSPTRSSTARATRTRCRTKPTSTPTRTPPPIAVSSTRPVSFTLLVALLAAGDLDAAGKPLADDAHEDEDAAAVELDGQGEDEVQDEAHHHLDAHEDAAADRGELDAAAAVDKAFLYSPGGPTHDGSPQRQRAHQIASYALRRQRIAYRGRRRWRSSTPPGSPTTPPPPRRGR